MSDPIVFAANACPVCGGNVMSYESMEGGDFTEGEYAYCESNCGWFGCVSVAEDGSAFPSSSDDIEDLVERLQELTGVLRECLAFACPSGEPPTNDLARRVAAVLEKQA